MSKINIKNNVKCIGKTPKIMYYIIVQRKQRTIAGQAEKGAIENAIS